MKINNNVLILKELELGFSTTKPLSGIFRLECDYGVMEISLSLINLSPNVNAELYLYIFDKKQSVYTFPLSARPTSFRKTLDPIQSLNDGFAVALVAIKEVPLTVAFGKTEGFSLSIVDVKKLVAEKCLTDRKLSRRKMEQVEQTESAQVNIEKESSEQNIYNDEAVATENYFEIDEEIKEKLVQIKENEELSNADGNATNKRQKEKEENTNGIDFLSNEEDLFSSASQESQPSRPFYITAEKELKTLFEKFPAYDNLKCYFPDSKWVKINYDNDKYYIVGLIKEDKKEKYICYGVPEKYSPQPPKELKGYCTFIPLSIFDMQGDGFWMMFQDAITGECVNKPEA